MGRRKIVKGKCRICGKEGNLSFEHVPPQSAFNKRTVIEYTLENHIAKPQKAKGKQRQGGIGKYTLCKKCNNDTGSWYASEYVKWARIADDIFSNINRYPDQFSGLNEMAITLNNVYPLRFLKQMVTCFFSEIGISPNGKFAENNPELVNFVLEKARTGLSEDYQFYLRLYESHQLRRYPIAGKIDVTFSKDIHGNIRPTTLQAHQASVFSEMAHPPFSLVMTHGSGFSDATNITHFKNYGYDEKIDLVISLKIGRSPSPYPGSYQAL